MKGKGRKGKPVNFLLRKDDTAYAKMPVTENKNDNTELKEVDDKLIGDDLEMAIVKEEITGNSPTVDKNENNY